MPSTRLTQRARTYQNLWIDQNREGIASGEFGNSYYKLTRHCRKFAMENGVPQDEARHISENTMRYICAEFGVRLTRTSRSYVDSECELGDIKAIILHLYKLMEFIYSPKDETEGSRRTQPDPYHLSDGRRVSEILERLNGEH